MDVLVCITPLTMLNVLRELVALNKGLNIRSSISRGDRDFGPGLSYLGD